MLFESYLRFLTLSRLVPRLLGASRNSELAYMTCSIATSYPGLLGDCVAISPGKNRNRNFKNLVVFSANQLSLQKSCSRTQDITTRSLII